MGSSISHAAAALPPPPPDPAVSPLPSLPPPVGLAVALPPTPSPEDSKAKPEKVDYKNLPCPVPFEEIKREANMSLNPEFFEGLNFNFNKGLNQKFYLSHSVFMGSMEVPSQSSDIIKVPTARYAFAANYVDPKLVLLGRVMMDGRLSAQVMCDLTDNLVMKIDAQLMNEPHYSGGVFNFEYKVRIAGHNSNLGIIHYIMRIISRNLQEFQRTYYELENFSLNRLPQSLRILFRLCGVNLDGVTPNLSLGSEVFWHGQQRTSTIGFAARYNTDKMVATGQVVNTGSVALSYVQKVSEKVSLASEFMYNPDTRDATASFGYDYKLRQCRLRGKIDTNGCVGTCLDEPMNASVNISLSAMIDHWKKDYKFGFGMTIG